jgi:diacylglycerol kinase family enzyme
VHHVQAERLRLTTSEGVPVNVDGELIKGGSFEVRVRPGVLTVLL